MQKEDNQVLKRKNMEKTIKKAKEAVNENLGATHFTLFNWAASNSLVVYRRITRHDFRV